MAVQNHSSVSSYERLHLLGQKVAYNPMSMLIPVALPMAALPVSRINPGLRETVKQAGNVEVYKAVILHQVDKTLRQIVATHDYVSRATSTTHLGQLMDNRSVYSSDLGIAGAPVFPYVHARSFVP